MVGLAKRCGVIWAIALGVMLASPVLGGSGNRPLNIVMLLVDDMGWTGARYSGSDLHETPHIDRLATEGMRFTHAYAAAPVCTPTRASIMTGKSPARLHMTIWHESARNQVLDRKLLPPDTHGSLPLSETTIAEVLRSAGYHTAHVGKWHLGDAAHYPENQGFDVNMGGTFWGCPATFFYPYRGLFGAQKEMRYVPDLPWGNPGDYLTDRLTDAALDVIDRVGDEPFFLNMCYYAVHTPIEGKPAVVAYYQEKIKEGMDHDNADYAAMHHILDENVGRILARLEARGLTDRTLVIFTSDNGGFVNEYRGRRVTVNRPLRSGKGSLYEGGIRVPMIVRWPGVTAAGSACDEVVVSTDLYPTLLEAAGLSGAGSGDSGIDGKSIVPLLKDSKATLERDAVFFHYPHYYATTSPVSAVRAGDWKLLEYHEDSRIELYNLKDDLGETQNLAARLPDKADELRRRLHTWRAQVGAQMPTSNPEFREPDAGPRAKKRA